MKADVVNGELVLSEMTFFARHGCLEEERAKGNTFKVDVSLRFDMTAACVSDSLEDTVDCREICRIAGEEMAVPSNLLENVAWRILKRIREMFDMVEHATVSVSKMNPPACCGAAASSVKVSF